MAGRDDLGLLATPSPRPISATVPKNRPLLPRPSDLCYDAKCLGHVGFATAIADERALRLGRMLSRAVPGPRFFRTAFDGIPFHQSSVIVDPARPQRRGDSCATGSCSDGR